MTKLFGPFYFISRMFCVVVEKENIKVEGECTTPSFPACEDLDRTFLIVKSVANLHVYPSFVCLLNMSDPTLGMAWAANSSVFGLSAKGLQQSAKNFLSGNVIPGRCGLLANKAKICFLQTFKIKQ